MFHSCRLPKPKTVLQSTQIKDFRRTRILLHHVQCAGCHADKPETERSGLCTNRHLECVFRRCISDLHGGQSRSHPEFQRCSRDPKPPAQNRPNVKREFSVCSYKAATLFPRRPNAVLGEESTPSLPGALRCHSVVALTTVLRKPITVLPSMPTLPTHHSAVALTTVLQST